MIGRLVGLVDGLSIILCVLMCPEIESYGFKFSGETKLYIDENDKVCNTPDRSLFIIPVKAIEINVRVRQKETSDVMSGSTFSSCVVLITPQEKVSYKEREYGLISKPCIVPKTVGTDKNGIGFFNVTLDAYRRPLLFNRFAKVDRDGDNYVNAKEFYLRRPYGLLRYANTIYDSAALTDQSLCETEGRDVELPQRFAVEFQRFVKETKRSRFRRNEKDQDIHFEIMSLIKKITKSECLSQEEFTWCTQRKKCIPAKNFNCTCSCNELCGGIRRPECDDDEDPTPPSSEEPPSEFHPMPPDEAPEVSMEKSSATEWIVIVIVVLVLVVAAVILAVILVLKRRKKKKLEAQAAAAKEEANQRAAGAEAAADSDQPSPPEHVPTLQLQSPSVSQQDHSHDSFELIAQPEDVKSEDVGISREEIQRSSGQWQLSVDHEESADSGSHF